MRRPWGAGATPGRRIGVHDRNQFEVKLEYEPAADAAESRYTVESYLCVPVSLNLEPETVPSHVLYGDIHNYIRLKTPELSWAALSALPESPLLRLEQELARLTPAGDPGAVTYQCRMFACVFRAGLRNLVAAVKAALATEAGLAERLAAATDLVTGGMDGWAAPLARYRALAPRIDGDQVPPRARAAWRLADEYASVSIEQLLRRAIVAVDRAAGGDAAAAPLENLLLQQILVEERYRKERRYPCILSEQGDNEGYVYRAGVLKKYCSSALFLHLHREQPQRRWQEVMSAVAAGIAMAFATVIAFWAQARYSRLGLQLFVILVAAYMFKDRIKEGARGIFARWLERHVYDRKIVIDDPAGGRLGTCREKIEYVGPERVPDDVREARARDRDPMLLVAEGELRGSVIRYRKEIVLSRHKLPDSRATAALTDIMRFHVARLTHQMDEPDHAIEWVDLETRRLAPLRAAKVYHVDVVFRFQVGGEPATTTLMRLILDRRGIKRIERSDPAA